jgi:hypothetical protein
MLHLKFTTPDETLPPPRNFGHTVVVNVPGGGLVGLNPQLMSGTLMIVEFVTAQSVGQPIAQYSSTSDGKGGVNLTFNDVVLGLGQDKVYALTASAVLAPHGDIPGDKGGPQTVDATYHV